MKKIKLAIVCGLAIIYSMIAFAQTKISQLPAGSALTGAELIPMVQAGTTSTTTTAALASYVGQVGGIVFANPTAQVGTAVVNGSATTAMRSDASPPINLAIAPTWTGNHTFTPASGTAITINGTGTQLNITGSGSQNDSIVNSSGVGYSEFFVESSAEIGFCAAATSGACNSSEGAQTTEFFGNLPMYVSSNTGQVVFEWAGSTGTTTLAYGPTAGGLVDLTPDRGSFTITYTGMSASTTGTARWSKEGNIVLLVLPALTGTSNATSFTAAGLPTEIEPSTTQTGTLVAEDGSNGTEICQWQVTASTTTITFGAGVGAAFGLWINTGTKGTPLAYTIEYMLN